MVRAHPDSDTITLSVAIPFSLSVSFALTIPKPVAIAYAGRQPFTLAESLAHARRKPNAWANPICVAIAHAGGEPHSGPVSIGFSVSFPQPFGVPIAYRFRDGWAIDGEGHRDCDPQYVWRYDRGTPCEPERFQLYR